jgi:hypothetical protein
MARVKFLEGTKLLIVADQQQPDVELDNEDVVAIRSSCRNLESGRAWPLPTR